MDRVWTATGAILAVAVTLAVVGCSDTYEVLSTRPQGPDANLDGGLDATGFGDASQADAGGADLGLNDADVGPDAGLLPIEPGLTHLAAGSEHTCLIADGRIFCFGTSDFASVGTLDGSLTTPTRIETTGDWVDLDAHRNTSCAKNQRSELWCWGHNDFGQAGALSPEFITGFNQVQLPGPVSGFSVGDHVSCAIVGPELYCWGLDRSGVFLGTNTGNIVLPQRVDVLEPPDTVEMGRENICVKTQRRVWCWGANPDRMLEVDTSADGVFQPLYDVTETRPLGVWLDLAMSIGHRCLIGSSGDARCSGANQFAQISDSGQPFEPNLTDVGLSGTNLAVSARNTCTLLDGALFCRGNNEFGQLGVASTGPTDNRGVVEVGDGNYELVAVGQFHICASRADRVVHCWGRGDDGQIGALLPGANPQTTESIIPPP